MSDQLSEHFSRKEFTCKCGCGFASVDFALLAGLEMLRARLGKPIAIRSGCRCEKHNAKSKGAKNSRHVQGKAADIAVAGMSARELYAAAKQIVQFAGFGVDDHQGYVHVDVRPVSARWCYNAAGAVIPWHEPNEQSGG